MTLPNFYVARILSGGQTGADRGALDAAIRLGIPHGGYCPAGRRAEDGMIPPHYRLVETVERDYAVRTERNILASDGTLLVTRGRPTGGSALTAKLAQTHKKPVFHVDLATSTLDEAAAEIRAWLAHEAISVLNVAGPRASHCPGIGADVTSLLEIALTAIPSVSDNGRP